LTAFGARFLALPQTQYMSSPPAKAGGPVFQSVTIND